MPIAVFTKISFSLKEATAILERILSVVNEPQVILTEQNNNREFCSCDKNTVPCLLLYLQIYLSILKRLQSYWIEYCQF